MNNSTTIGLAADQTAQGGQGMIGRMEKFAIGTLPALAVSGLLVAANFGLARMNGDQPGGVIALGAGLAAVAAVISGAVRAASDMSPKQVWLEAQSLLKLEAGMAGCAVAGMFMSSGLLHAADVAWASGSALSQAGAVGMGLAATFGGIASVATAGVSVYAAGKSAISPMDQPLESESASIAERLASRRARQPLPVAAQASPARISPV